MNKLKTIFRSLHWKNILGLTIAGLINAFGITIFLSPVNLYDTFCFPYYFKYSTILIWLEKAGIYLHHLCDLCSCDLLSGCMVDYRCPSCRCPICISACRLRSASVRTLWRSDLRCGKRTCDPFWRCNGWYRDTCNHICQTPWHHRRNLCYGI